jgi:hypothetical protein
MAQSRLVLTLGVTPSAWRLMPANCRLLPSTSNQQCSNRLCIQTIDGADLLGPQGPIKDGEVVERLRSLAGPVARTVMPRKNRHAGPVKCNALFGGKDAAPCTVLADRGLP